nr:lysine--tRNA ligase [Clostridia bacterium]
MPEEINPTDQDALSLREIRINKLRELQSAGEDPFAVTTAENGTDSETIRRDFESLENTDVSICGRIVTWRDMGKANFVFIQDRHGKIQVYVRVDDIGEAAFKAFKTWDIGDIVEVKGFVFRTRRGEISVHAKQIKLISKSLLPLPEKFHGLRDTDARYRRRYVDLIVNPDVKDTFEKRSLILRKIREFMDSHGFLEVDTPILLPIEIGASARPFVTHHNTLGIDMYLRIETELYLKRLIVGGMERVYEVGRIFRNEGMDPRHNPEFTTVEFYQAYADYHDMMDFIEQLYAYVTDEVCSSGTITYQGTEIKMSAPWARMTMAEAVKKYSGEDYYAWKDDASARSAAEKAGVRLEKENATKGEVLSYFFDAFVEDKLIQPTFIYDYPVDISPLAKRKPDEPDMTQRFEYFINGTEM